MFKNIKAALVLARSMSRIADALEEQNHIRKVELQELHNLSIPDPKKKWSKKELETEISYESISAAQQDESQVDEWEDIFKDH